MFTPIARQLAMFAAIRRALAGCTPGAAYTAKPPATVENRRLCLVAPNDVRVPNGIIVGARQ
jgi:hypothetical protein